MNSKTMKELLFSLSWYDSSAYHVENVNAILKAAFPEEDFSTCLADFEQCVTMAPGAGCPR